MSRTPAVVVIGETRVDVVARAPRPLEPTTHVELSGLGFHLGGRAALAAAAASALGCRTRLASVIADDDGGRIAVGQLLAAGVDVAAVKRRGTSTPAGLRLLVDGRPTQALYPGDVGVLGLEDVDLEALLARADGLLLDGHHAPGQIAAAEQARDRGIKVFVDLDDVAAGAGELAALADVLVASERFVSEIAPRGEIEEALVEIARMGPDVVIVTEGEDGAVGLFGETLVQQPAFQVRVVDPRGAGDVFHGALAAAILDGATPAIAMARAAAAAACMCMRAGTLPLPSAAEIARLVGE